MFSSFLRQKYFSHFYSGFSFRIAIFGMISHEGNLLLLYSKSLSEFEFHYVQLILALYSVNKVCMENLRKN